MKEAKTITDLQRMKDFIASYPGFDILGTFNVDYTDQVPSTGAIFPSGLTEIARREDILGNVTLTNQYNFGLYCVFAKDGDMGAQVNADWVMDFQNWAQEQSARGLAPKFGNTGDKETLKAQNGIMYDQADEGTATYMVQLSVQFKRKFEAE